MSSTSRSKEIDGQNTDVLLQYYADRILVVVTQFGKVGNLVLLVNIRFPDHAG